MVGADYQRVGMEQLRSLGIDANGVVRRISTLPPVPAVDGEYYRGLASANSANAAINKAAGDRSGDEVLARKRDSLYGQEQFQLLLAYLQSDQTPRRLQGVIYVVGGVSLPEGQRLQITDGALIAEHTVQLHPGARLEITHAGTTRTLPGLLVTGDGALFVTSNAHLQVHGLAYAARLIDVHPSARVDVIGSLISADPYVGLRSDAAQVVIRYDPTTLGSIGLHVPDGGPAIAWVAVWEEQP